LFGVFFPDWSLVLAMPKKIDNNQWLLLGSPATVVTVMTLILSRGNFLAASGAGITTAVSSVGAISIINRRLYTKLEFLENKQG
jgi:hypothetical protein